MYKMNEQEIILNVAEMINACPENLSIITKHLDREDKAKLLLCDVRKNLFGVFIDASTHKIAVQCMPSVASLRLFRTIKEDFRIELKGA